MTNSDGINSYKQLDNISKNCLEIQRALTQHHETTTNAEYKADIEKDSVTLENLKLIISAVKEDIEIGRVGASTELLLRIAANDFKNKLAKSPEKRTQSKEILKDLKEVHGYILNLKIHEKKL
jgi:hypothetical protein